MSAGSPARGWPRVVIGSAVTLAVAWVAERALDLDDTAVVFLLGVFVIATRSSIGQALLAAVLGVLAYNVLFIEPRNSLHIASARDAVTAGVFFAAALLAARLGSRMSSQLQSLEAASLRAEARQQLAHGLVAAGDEDAVAAAAATVFEQRLAATIVLVVDGRQLGSQTASSAAADPGDIERTLELRAPRAGSLLVRRRDGPAFDDAERDLVDELAGDVTQALVRIDLTAALESQRVANETERLRSALLASVSHDLRSPLSGIIGAAGTLENYSDAMSEADRRSLLETIRLEGERLDRYIQNLLDMTRLGHSTLPLSRDWIGVDELIGAAIARALRQWPAARFDVAIAADVGPIWVHAALIEQALFNIIENAVTFAPAGEAVAIAARAASGNRLCIEVCDGGPGIPEAERARVFDMFYSVERGDRGRNGTGLGLAICRGMVGAHGGEVEADVGRHQRGTCMRVMLPLLEPDA